MNDQTETLQDRIREYVRIEGLLAEQEAKSKILSRQLKEQEILVCNAFAWSDTTDITVDGRRWKPDFTPKLSPLYPEGASDVEKANVSAQIAGWIKEHGGADLIKPSLHWASRDSFLNQTLVDDDGEVHIPEELEGLVKVFDEARLTKRKV